MKRKMIGLMAIVMGLTAVFSAPVVMSEPVNAESCYCELKSGEKNREKGVVTIFFGGTAYKNETGDETIIDKKCSCGSGQVEDVLNLAVQIMTVAVGVLGVLGIVIIGTQYLTAGDNEEKTRKAKRRMFELVLGLVIYVLMYALLSWLLPAFNS